MKSSNNDNESSFIILKNAIEETFGKRIGTSRDCILLSEDVYNRITININSNTLRRFFGLIKSDYFPSSTTLDILSKYCGFASFDEFLRLKTNISEAGNPGDYSGSILNYLVSLFRYTPAKDYNDKTFFVVVEYTIYFLQRHPELVDRFQRAISKTRNGQDFYYEQFINIDGLNSFYGEGLRYYLAEKNTEEAQIFGHSLLCLKGWLSGNLADVNKHHDEVIKHRLSKSFHPVLCARFFSSQLLYADINGLPMEKLLIKAQHLHTSIRQEMNAYRSFPYFEYIIAPVLLLTGRAEEALYYVNYSLSDYPHRDTNIEPGFYQTMNLIKALTFSKTGRKKDAEKLYHQVHPSKFYFLTKKTNTIMYLFLSQYLNKNNLKSDQQLKDLIMETGFTRLKRILSEKIGVFN